MKFYKCTNCKFNVTLGDVYCPNCGLYSPLESVSAIQKKDIDSEKLAVTIMVVVGIAVFVPCVIYFGGEAGGPGIICCALPVGIILFIIFSFFRQ